jgi:hypothetical protein
MPTRLMRNLVRGLLVAMLLALLAPTISRALASTRGAGDWVEVCSAQGMQWVQLAADGEPLTPADPQHAFDHCGHCVLTAERFAPMLPSMPVLQADTGKWAAPIYRAFKPFARTAPSPGARGPPLLS